MEYRVPFQELDSLHSDAQFGEGHLFDFMLGQLPGFASERHNLVIDYFRPSEHFVERLLQAFIECYLRQLTHGCAYSCSLFDLTLIRLASLKPTLIRMSELCTDYDSLCCAVASASDGAGARLFTLRQLCENESFLRECPLHARHRIYTDGTQTYPTPCVRTRYELRRRPAIHEGRAERADFLFTSVLVEISSCEVGGRVWDIEEKHQYTDEIMVRVVRADE